MANKNRIGGIDCARGIALVAIMIDHVPGNLLEDVTQRASSAFSTSWTPIGPISSSGRSAPTTRLQASMSRVSAPNLNPASRRRGLGKFPSSSSILSSILESRILARFERFVATVGEVGAKAHVPVFSRFAMMKAWADPSAGALRAYLSPDQFHMGDQGYACFARALASDIARQCAGRSADANTSVPAAKM